MADFTRNLDAFDPNWLHQLSYSPLRGGFSDFLNDVPSSDSFCLSCRRFPSASAVADDDYLARHLSALSLLRNHRRPALNPPPPAGLYLQRLKTAAIAAAAAATVRENNNSIATASAYPRLPRVSPLGFNGGGAPSPPPEQLRPRKHAAAAARPDPLHEVNIRKPYQSGGYSSSKGNGPGPIRSTAGSGGVFQAVQKQRTRIPSRVYPYQGNDLGSKESSAGGSGTGVFIPLAPPDSAAATEYFKSKLLISGKQRRDPRRVGGRAAAAGGGGEVAVAAGGKHTSTEEGGKKARRSSGDEEGKTGDEEEEDCHYHLPPDLIFLPADWTN